MKFEKNKSPLVGAILALGLGLSAQAHAAASFIELVDTASVYQGVGFWNGSSSATFNTDSSYWDILLKAKVSKVFGALASLTDKTTGDALALGGFGGTEDSIISGGNKYTYTLSMSKLGSDLFDDGDLIAKAGSYKIDFAANVAAVPEPATYAMFLAGLGMVGLMSRRRVK